VVPIPHIRASGQPNKIAPYCLSSDTHANMTWYYLTSVPSTLMCTYCHARYVVNTPLATGFESTVMWNGRCDFATDPIRELLRDGDPAALVDYMGYWFTIPKCHGPGVQAAESALAYRVVGSDVDFDICGACFEDDIAHTPFASYFEQTPKEGPWSCDMPHRFTLLALNKLSRRSPPHSAFDEWWDTVQAYSELPACDGRAVVASELEWFEPRRGAQGVIICKRCYLDWFAYTRFADEWVPRHDIGDIQVTCDIGSLYSPLRWTADVAVAHGTFNAFLAAADAYVADVHAEEDDSPRTFYTLSGPDADWDMCQRCHAYATTCGLGTFFVERPEQGPRVCDVCNPSFRSIIYLLGLGEVMRDGVFAPFDDLVRRLVDLPPCPRLDDVRNGRWYGYDELTSCPQCWESFGRHTSLADDAPFQNELLDDARICSLYSERMRSKWMIACENDDPSDVLAFSEQRTVIYTETVMKAKQIRKTQDQAQAFGLMQLQMGVQLQMAGRFRSIIGGKDNVHHMYNGSRYGSSTEAQGHSAYDAGWKYSTAALQNIPIVNMQCAELMDRWAEVE
jgi:hypothetical protein